MTNSAIVRTPLFSHKRALKTISNRCTNHCNHPLSEKKIKKRPGAINSRPQTDRYQKNCRNIIRRIRIVNKKFDFVLTYISIVKNMLATLRITIEHQKRILDFLFKNCQVVDTGSSVSIIPLYSGTGFPTRSVKRGYYGIRFY